MTFRNNVLTLVALVAALYASALSAQVNGNPNQAPLAPPPMATWPQQGNDPGAYGANNGNSNVQNGYEFRCLASDIVVTRLGVCTPNNQRVSYTARLWDATSGSLNYQQVLRQGATAIERGWAWSEPGPIRLTNGNNYIVTVTGNEWFYLDLNGSTQPQQQTRDVWNLRLVNDLEHISVRNSASSTSFPNRPTTATQDFLWGAADCEFYRVADLKLTAAAETATQPAYYSSEQGAMDPSGPRGVSAGSFTLTANDQPWSRLISVTIAGSPAGVSLLNNSPISPMGVALFRDSSGGTVGEYDPADVQIDSWKNITSNATIATGAAIFDVPAGGERVFSNDQTKRYFVVVRLNGTAQPGSQILFSVADMDVRSDEADIASGTAEGVGLNTQLTGIRVLTPDFNFTDVSGAQRFAYAGTAGNVLHAVDVSYPAGATGTLNTMEFTAAGSGHDVDDINTLGLYYDSNSNGSYDSTDLQVGGNGAFSGDNGTVSFSVTGASSSFAAGTTRRFFLVASFNTAPNPSQNDTFTASVSAASAANGVNVNGLPAGPSAGISIAGNGLYATINGPTSNTTINNDDADFLLMDFSLAAINEAWVAQQLEFTASGSMDPDTDIMSVALYADTDGDGQFNIANDMLATSTAGSFGNNNLYTAMLTNGNFNNVLTSSNNLRRFFLVATFAGTAASGETLSIQLSDAPNSSVVGGGAANRVGIPSDTLAVASVGDASIVVTMNGPTQVMSINNDSTGPSNNGEMLLDVTLQGFNQSYTVTSLTFKAGEEVERYADAISELALYEDGNNDGQFTSAFDDPLATDAVRMDGFDTMFQYVATLRSNAQTLDGSTGARRFFLLAKFNGTARPGALFNAHLSAIQTTPAGGNVTGVPTANSAGLNIDGALLTVAKGTTPGANAQDRVGLTDIDGISQTPMAAFSFSAVNSDAAISRLTFTLAGNGNWLTDLDDTDGPIIPGSDADGSAGVLEYTGLGFQLWVDDGDAIFDTAFDTRVFAGEGTSASMLTCELSPSIIVPNGGTTTLFVVLGVKEAAAMSTPTTFECSIAQASDVAEEIGAMVTLDANNAPESSELVVLDFSADISPVAGGAGTAITLTGSGLYQVVGLSINGNPCGGTPNANATYTEVTGFTAPSNVGSCSDIVLTTSLVTYTFSTKWGCSSGGGGGGGGGCALSDSSNLLTIMILLGLAGASIIAMRLRKAE